jgi:hypothetical protein
MLPPGPPVEVLDVAGYLTPGEIKVRYVRWFLCVGVVNADP